MDYIKCLVCGEIVENNSEAIRQHDKEDEFNRKAYDKLAKEWGKIYGIEGTL